MDALVIVVGAIGFLTELARWAIDYYRKWDAERRSADKYFQEAIESLDLETVGNYLQNRLGKIELSAYAGDKSAKVNVDRHLRALAGLVEKEPEVGDGLPNGDELLAHIEPTTTWHSTIQILPSDPPAIQLAISNLKSGEIWSALARIRRDLEIRLRILADARGVSANKLPVHQLSKVLELPDDVRQRLQAFFRVANAAVHGEEVTLEAALDAIQYARAVYRLLDEEHLPKPPEELDR